MRKVLRIIITVILVIVLLLVIADLGVYIWLKTNPDKVAEYIGEQTGNNVEAGSVEGEFLFGFRVTDLIIYPSDNPLEQRLLRASSANIGVSFASMLHGKLFPSHVTVDDFDVFLTINEKGELVLPTFSPYAAQGGEATIPLDLPSDVDIHLTRGSVYLDWHVAGKSPAQAEMREVRAKGKFTKKGTIVVGSLIGKPDFATKEIHVSGNINPFAGNIDMTVSGEGINLWEFSSSFRPLFTGVPNNMLPAGTAGCDAAIKGPLDDVSVDGRLTLSQGKLANIKVDSGDITFSYSNDVLEISEGTVNCYGGTIDLNAELLLAKGPAYRFYIDFNRLDINAYLEEMQLYLQETEGKFQGHFEGYGEFDNPDSFLADGYFVSTNGSYLSPFHAEIPSLPERLSYNALRLDFEIARGTIAIESLLLEGNDLGVLATGTLNLRRQLELKGQMKFPHAIAHLIPELKKWAPILPTNKKGQVVLDFTLKGDLMDPEFDVKLPGNIFEGFLEGDIDILGGVEDLVGKIF